MKTMRIANRSVGQGHPCFIIAEMSANHNQDFNKAKRLIEIAKACGADAIKLQTYTADSLTLSCGNDYFMIKSGPWRGQTLHDLYKKAQTPISWQKDLKAYADEIGIICFSSPFDCSAVDFLESIDVPAYKIASFEIVDIPLIKYVASKKKPIILSTGMSSLGDIELALETIHSQGNEEVILLKCTSAYPANPSEMNIVSIGALRRTFGVLAGLSDHSLANDTSIAAVSLGACIIEKHITERRSDGGPDAAFSLEPTEFAKLIESVRNVEAALGNVQFGPSGTEVANMIFRKSIFVAQDIAEGESFSRQNIRVVRPGYGLHPKYFEQILGKVSNCSISFGTPLKWAHIKDE
jgi:pseudaminic acid synthase